MLPLAVRPAAAPAPARQGPPRPAGRAWQPLAGALLLLCLLTAPGRAEAQPFEPVERPLEEEWVFQVRLRQQVLSDAMLAYVSGEEVLVPLGQLAVALEFPIDTDPTAGRAFGWFLRESRRFSLNLAAGVVESDGETYAMAPGTVEPHVDDLYVSTEALAQWFPLSLEVNRFEAVIYVHPREPLPLQQRARRSSRRSTIGAVLQRPEYPRVEVPYRPLSWPFVGLDLVHDVQRAGPDAEVVDVTRYEQRMAGDLLYAEARLAMLGDDMGGLRDLRFSLGRRDAEGRLLAPLGLTEIAGGDVFAPPLPLISEQREGRGALISSFPLGRPLEADRTTLRGELPPGWEVELYNNGVLIAFQEPDPEGRYTFIDVPLVFGTNELRLVFYGPQGQVREETRTLLITPELLRPGELRYRISRTDDNRDTLPVEPVPPEEEQPEQRTIASLEVGLVRSLSASLSAARYHLSDLPREYAGAGLRLAVGEVLVRLDAAQELTAEEVLAEDPTERALAGLLEREPRRNAQQVGLQTRFWGIGLLMEHARFQEFASEREPPSVDPIQDRSRLRFDFQIPAWLLPAISFSLDGELEERLSGAFQGQVSNRVATRVWGVSLSNTLDYFALGTDGRVTDEFAQGQALISARFGPVTLRGLTDYRVEITAHDEELVPTRRGLTVRYRFGDRYSASAGAFDELTGERRRVYNAGLARTFPALAVALSGTQDSEGAYSIRLSLSTSFGYDPRQGYVPHGRDIALGGAVSTETFVDADGDGMRGPHEEPLPGVGFLGRGEARTDAQGHLYMAGLPPYYPANIVPDLSTLEDPLMRPGTPGVTVMPRPGVTALVDVPVVRTTDIEGTMYLEQADRVTEAANVRLELVDEDGRIVREVRSEFDGYFLFGGVAPGNYRLRVSPEQAGRLRLETPEPVPLTIRPDTGLVSGLELRVVRRPLPGAP